MKKKTHIEANRKSQIYTRSEITFLFHGKKTPERQRTNLRLEL